MKKTLLVDTNRAAYPVYRELERLGHDIWVVGNDPFEPLARMVKNYISFDYSDLSKLDSLIEREQFDFLVPGCNDLSYAMCAEVNKGRFPGIDSTQVTRTINKKSMFNRLTKDLSIPSPASLTLSEAIEVRSVIVKPVDSFSGRGISVVIDPSEKNLNEAIELAASVSHTKEHTIEEFVDGQLYSYSAFLDSGQVKTGFVVREDCSANPFAVDISCVDFSFPDDLRYSLVRDVEALARHLELNSGLVHVQFILREGRYFVIEMTRRCPGDLYSLLIEHSTGYNYAAAYLSAFLGQSIPEPTSALMQQEAIIRHTVTGCTGEPYFGLEFHQPVSIKRLVPLCSAGECFMSDLQCRAAIVFIQAESAEKKNKIYQQLIARKLYALR